MDEVHYLADRFRGAVWEEVIIHLPESVRLVALSATVSNVEEFAGWLRTVRGDTKSIVWEHRPVPLWQHVLSGRRMFDLFANGADGEAMPGANGQGGISASRELRVNPELVRLNREGSESMYKRGGPRGGGGGGPRQRGRVQRAAAAAGCPAGSTSSRSWTPRACCRPSPSSSAAPAATPRSSSSCTPVSGC